MGRKVKWQISFRTRSERLGVLSLYEEGYDGDIIELTGASVPFETQEDSSDKWLEPIRKQTGYIRVIDEGNTEGIMPVGMKDRYVEYTENGVLKWCGYMVPDVYSSDWDVTPLEVEFPVVGGLGVLEGVYMNEDDGLGVVSFAQLLVQCLAETGISYNMIYFPKEVFKDNTMNDDLFPWKVEVSRYNFFGENDSLNMEDEDWTRYNGQTCYDVIAEIMKFWGWTIRERGNDLWITSTGGEGSVAYSYSEFTDYVEGIPLIQKDRDVQAYSYDIESLGLAGADHKKDILQGRKKVVVKASVNPVGAVVPSVDKGKMKMVLSTLGENSVNGQVYAYEKRKQYEPKEGYTDVVFRSYAKQTPFSTAFDKWKEVSNIKETSAQGSSLYSIGIYIGAYFVERERVTTEEYKKKRNWNLTDCIMMRLQSWDYLYPNEEDLKEMKFLEMRSRKVANYVNGAFVISASTKNIYETVGASEAEGNGAGELEVMFRVGEKYWNGQAWVNDAVWFNIKMGDENDANNLNGTGKIISTKTLDMPYDGADGYVIPITEQLTGEIELDLRRASLAWDVSYFLILENLKVDYYAEEADEKKSDEAENRYAKTTGVNYTNEEEISLAMATNNNNKAGYGILSLEGANIETMYFVGKGMERPEMNLVKKGVELYGRNTEKLTLQLDKADATPQDKMKWNGKKYMMASEAVNWADETGQYIIMEVGE